VIHIEPRGFNYNNLWCTAEKGNDAMIQLRDTIFETLGTEKIYHPAMLTRNCPPTMASGDCMSRPPASSILDALERFGWPQVSALAGRFVLSMNLFGSNGSGNQDCRLYYNAMESTPSSQAST